MSLTKDLTYIVVLLPYECLGEITERAIVLCSDNSTMDLTILVTPKYIDLSEKDTIEYIITERTISWT